MLNEFNKFFNSIAKKMNAKAFSSELSTAIDSKGFRKYLNNGDKITSSMFLQDCSETEIEETIMNLENDEVFNCFMTNGSLPTILKNGSITPIYKKGDSRYMDNYTPVSALPIFGKIFRKNHSTSRAINYSVNMVLSQLEAKKHTIGIFIDLSKAFDTLKHSMLLEKLKHYGIRGRCNNILKSFLSNRTQQSSRVHCLGNYQLNLVCLKDLFLAHFYFLYMSMIS